MASKYLSQKLCLKSPLLIDTGKLMSAMKIGIQRALKDWRKAKRRLSRKERLQRMANVLGNRCCAELRRIAVEE